MVNFNQTLRPTPFGLYDSDIQFQRDADSMVVFVMRKLGEDILSVELTKKEIWACFEEACREFNGYIIEYQAISNLVNLLGTSTGSIDSTTGLNTINLTNAYVGQNLEFLDRLAEPYANIIGFGSTQDSFSGSIHLRPGVQNYDLYTELVNDSGNPIYTTNNPTGGKMRIYEVFHFMPLQYVFNSNLASNFVAQGLPVESYIPDTRFYVLPLFEDILRADMLKSAAKVRRSHYSYKISGRNIQVFPAPSNLIEGLNNQLWIRVGFTSNATPFPSGSFFDASGSLIGGGTSTTAATYFGASNPANVPFGLVTYATLNQWAKNWIMQYTLALAREVLGSIRRKIKSLPIPGATLELDGEELVTQAREDKERLLTHLNEYLQGLSFSKLAEQQATQAENLMKQMSFLPMPPAYAIKIW